MNDSDSNQNLLDEREISAIEQFCNVTGSDESCARATLEACNWNIELAINMHVDGIEASSAGDIAPSLETPSIHPTASSSRTSTSQEVRPPIPPVRQVLVDDGYRASLRGRTATHSVFDALRDFQAETRWFENSSEEGSTPPRYNKRRTLEELFRPPLDLLFRGSMSSAREYAVHCNKWLMVNVQNVQEFSCQVLNRDVWSNHAVKEIINAHFIFWQVYHDSSEGQRYMLFYNVLEFPYVAIIDPRTGEKLKSWSTELDSLTFCELVTQFLNEYPSPNGIAQSPCENQVTTAVQSFPMDKIIQNPYEESEEAQLEAAIAASLKDTTTTKNNHQNNSWIGDTDDDGSDLETFDSDTEAPSTSKLVKPDTQGECLKNGAALTSDSNYGEWKKYLGPDNGKYSELVIRFPDGRREQMSFPAESKLKALLMYISSKGYNMEEHDLVTCFPKKNLKELSSDDTLSSIGLCPRETVFVHLKS